MTLFLDGIPSAGGPRSRLSRGTRGAFSAFSLVSLASLSLVSVLVVSVKGRTSPAGSSAPSSPRDY